MFSLERTSIGMCCQLHKDKTDVNRQLKKEIYQTNHNHPERDLLQRLNLQITVRLLIDGAFESTHASITAQFRALRATCPHLFDNLLPRSDRLQQAIDLGDEACQSVQQDNTHRNVALYSRIQATYCKNILNLPTRSTHLSWDHSRYRIMLSSAYERDYMRPNVSTFGSRPIKYWKRIAFDDM